MLLSVAACGCADLTAPSDYGPPQPAKPATTTAVATAQPKPTPKPAPPSNEQVSASHVLISYKGSTRSQATRSKEEAKKIATQVRDQARKGADFAKLAQKFSDGPSKTKGGDLGAFTRNRMVKPFADAAFALKVNGVSDVVETPFGFHVIKRTK